LLQGADIRLITNERENTGFPDCRQWQSACNNSVKFRCHAYGLFAVALPQKAQMNFDISVTPAKLIPAMLAVVINLSFANPAFAVEDAPNLATAPADSAISEPEQWGLHGQLTNITMKHADFNAAYSGANSLSAVGPTVETTDMTLFIGHRLWHDAEIWLNPEVDQGFGFNDTLGMAGYPSGGAYKVGANTPYLRLPRAFMRQVFNLGGGEEKVEAGANQLSNINTENNVTVTIGKFAVPDIFDTNSYAHDPRADFLNWSIVEGGAFDYAADPWGYTYGAALEWKQDWWTLRGAMFEL
jgi:high affinity Mn2+ porin